MTFYFEYPSDLTPYKEDVVLIAFADTLDEATQAIKAYLITKWSTNYADEIHNLKLKQGGESRPNEFFIAASPEYVAREYYKESARAQVANQTMYDAATKMRQLETAIQAHLPDGISIVTFQTDHGTQQSVWRQEGDESRAQCLDVAAPVISKLKKG